MANYVKLILYMEEKIKSLTAENAALKEAQEANKQLTIERDNLAIEVKCITEEFSEFQIEIMNDIKRLTKERDALRNEISHKHKRVEQVVEDLIKLCKNYRKFT